MARSISKTPAKKGAERTVTKPAAKIAAAQVIRFTAKLLRPEANSAGHGGDADSGNWTFLILPKPASAQLPARGMVSVEGSFNDLPFQATLQPDGAGGHWLKLDQKLHKSVGAPKVGATAKLEITPIDPEREPEPAIPTDVKNALAAAPAKAREVWSDITPIARRDWIQWMTSGKRAETRGLRIDKACDMLAKGKRRPCCFDRSGMFDKSLSCPIADDDTAD